MDDFNHFGGTNLEAPEPAADQKSEAVPDHVTQDGQAPAEAAVLVASVPSQPGSAPEVPELVSELSSADAVAMDRAPGSDRATIDIDIELAGTDNTTAIGYLDGDYHAHYHRERLRSSKISMEGIGDKIRSLFVSPDGFEAVKETLFRGRACVALISVEEGGRAFAARALLAAVQGLTPRKIDPRSDPYVEPTQLAEHAASAWLLDLTDVEIGNWTLLFEHLAGLEDDLRKQRSILVAVLGVGDITEAQARERGVARLSSPDPYLVLQKHLAAAMSAGRVPSGVTPVADWVSFARQRRLIDGKPPAEAVRLCEAIRYAVNYWYGMTNVEQESLKEEFNHDRRASESAEGDVYIQLLALDRFQTWETELDLWNERNQDRPRLRAFQLAIAVLPSGDPIRIRNAATTFLESVDEGAVHVEGLSGPGTRLLARDSLAELKNGKVAFTRPGFDEAVVRYFWDDWPEHRGKLLAWLMGLASNDGVERDDQEILKERIGEFAIRHAQQRGEFDFLYEVVSTWAGKQATLIDAARLLERAATASGISRGVRDRTLQWVKQENRALKRAVAEVCASQTFAPLHPRLVITRLSYLMNDRSRGEADPVVEEALRRACQMLVTEAHQSNAVLAWLGSDVKAEKPELRQRAARLFLPIAQARSEGTTAPALIEQGETSGSVQAALVPVWGGVLRDLEDEEIQPAFNIWMEACTTIEVENFVIGVLRDAVATNVIEAGEANQTGARLSFRWKAVSTLPPERVAELDGRLLAALRDGEAAVVRQALLVGQQDGE
ncbi:hypothetical protein AB0I28_33450 [Phytomonospora sp. NPDC050363]|uniref:hypothetical protein n=1 Tax=Phytomonospora sp. NPDC050363 TaxID=3155642 RepID=UPI0033F070C3